MLITKQCSVCNHQFSYDPRVAENPFVQPYSDGAKYYYNLWHTLVEECPNCGYASMDITKCSNKDIISSDKVKNISKMDILVELNNTRPNRIECYMKAACYYESIGDVYNEILCLFQAGDLVYGELMYWQEYVFDNTDSIAKLINQTQYNELKKFGDVMFNSAIEKLETYVRDNPHDIDAKLLLAGNLCDGNKVQVLQGSKILSTLHSYPLSQMQMLALSFLEGQVR